MAIPNFRRIYSQFRSPDEEKSLSNQAVFKFAAFLSIILVMSIAKRNAFPGASEVSAPEIVEVVAETGSDAAKAMASGT